MEYGWLSLLAKCSHYAVVMFPLSDTNPTVHRSWINVVLIILCMYVYLVPQQNAALTNVESANDFVFAWAAIPCEVTTGSALSSDAIDVTLSGRGDGPCHSVNNEYEQSHPMKPVRLALLTSIFMHGSLLHLLSNMWFLNIFGNNIEDHFGHIRYLIFYIFGGIVAGVAHVAVQPLSTIPVVGASGAIAAVMGAYFVWFPKAPIRTLFFIFPVRVSARWWLGVWFIGQFFTSPNAQVAWMAHVGGFVFGAVVGALVRYNYGLRQLLFTQPYRGDVVWSDRGQVPIAYMKPPTRRR